MEAVRNVSIYRKSIKIIFHKKMVTIAMLYYVFPVLSACLNGEKVMRLWLCFLPAKIKLYCLVVNKLLNLVMKDFQGMGTLIRRMHFEAWASEAEYGGVAPLDFKNFSKTGCFLSFEWEKTNFTTFGQL